MANVGMVGLDWQERINWDRLRKHRLDRARERMKAHGLGAMLLMYDENVRYVTSTLTPGWNRLKPGLRYALLCGDDAPVLFEQGDIGVHIAKHSPWIPKENIRYSYAWIKGAAGPASLQQVTKFTNAHQKGNEKERRRRAEARRRLHRHQHDPDFQGQQDRLGRRHDADDGSARRQERGRARMHAPGRRDRRRRALGIHEIPEARAHREPADRAHHEVPLRHSGHGRRGRRDRVVGPEHLAELAQLLRPHHQAGRHGVHGPGRADLERLQVVLLPHLHGGPRAEPGAKGRITQRR